MLDAAGYFTVHARSCLLPHTLLHPPAFLERRGRPAAGQKQVSRWWLLTPFCLSNWLPFLRRTSLMRTQRHLCLPCLPLHCLHRCFNMHDASVVGLVCSGGWFYPHIPHPACCAAVRCVRLGGGSAWLIHRAATTLPFGHVTTFPSCRYSFSRLMNGA
jgi:hypothetical protein